VGQYSPVARIKTPQMAALELVQRDFPEYHPLTALAKMAHREDVTCDAKLELEVHKAILPYVTPKLAAQELKITDGNDDRRVLVSLFEDVLLEDGTSVMAEVPLVREVSEVVPLD
jgi:hypothetical protein